MPIYGYNQTVVDPEYGLLEMREVSFDLRPADLRRIAAFLNHFADEIESGAWRSDHAHLESFDRQWGRDHPELQIVVCHLQSNGY